MYWKTSILAAAAILAIAVGPLATVRSAFAACDPGAKIDKSTAATAKKKIEAAGYSQL